ncbi:hypothetical protein JTB14_034802 [Gonioctena quinquepunctata]|nr:hypothetical protein JTB14_034802 [Gonioctena quinquepunctata]
MDMLEEDDNLLANVDNIFVEPPDPNVDTDEDSADEDEGGMVCNLNGRQLCAPAEIKLLNGERIGECNRYDWPDNEILVVVPVRQMPSTENQEWITNRISEKAVPNWIPGDIEPNAREFPKADYSMYKALSPIQLFEIIFDDSVFQYLAKQTQIYARFKNEADPGISASEIRCFIAILILSGYNPPPSKRLNWDLKDDVHNKMVADSMRRDRFLNIQRFIHMADNTQIDQSDKAWKLRPLMNAIKEKCLANFQPVQDMSYDESMIRYYGRHGCKQFIRGKPIRFGFKMWSLNSKDGYLVDSDLYQRYDSREDVEISKLVGKCAAPLILMLKEIPVRNLPYVIYIDNLFTGMNLLAFLRTSGYGAIGTIRENRIGKSCPLTRKQDLKKRSGE